MEVDEFKLLVTEEARRASEEIEGAPGLNASSGPFREQRGDIHWGRRRQQSSTLVALLQGRGQAVARVDGRAWHDFGVVVIEYLRNEENRVRAHWKQVRTLEQSVLRLTDTLGDAEALSEEGLPALANGAAVLRHIWDVTILVYMLTARRFGRRARGSITGNPPSIIKRNRVERA
jgi:hypothetical protein